MKLKIPITIQTNHNTAPENSFQSARQKVEVSATHLVSIFRLLETAAISNYENPNDNFLDDVVSLTSLGRAVADSLYQTAVPMLTWESGQAPEPAIVKTPDKYEKLSIALSDVLRDETTPTYVYNILNGAVSEIFNSFKTDISKEMEYENSVEYINRILQGIREDELE